MAGMVLVVANGEWPSDELVQTLLNNAEFTIALDGAADRFVGWDVIIGDLDSIANPEGIKKDENQQNSDLAKALIEYEVDAVVGVEGGRLDHRLAAFSALFESQSDAILSCMQTCILSHSNAFASICTHQFRVTQIQTRRRVPARSKTFIPAFRLAYN